LLEKKKNLALSVASQAVLQLIDVADTVIARAGSGWKESYVTAVLHWIVERCFHLAVEEAGVPKYQTSARDVHSSLAADEV
jgi:hypothetical protein